MNAERQSQRRRSAWRTVALFAAIGLMINVLLAWMFSLLASPDQFNEAIATVVDGYPQNWPAVWPPSTPRDWPRVQRSVVGECRGLNYWLGASSDRGEGGHRDFSLLEVQSGWPFRSLRWRAGTIFDPINGTGESLGGWWISIPDWAEGMTSANTPTFHARRRLPIEPMWLGLLTNTALFGGGLWLLLRLRRTVRRWLRHRRHQCLECGYPIGASDLCTECGSPVHLNLPVKTSVADRA
jgi:hypothetical protein